MKMQFSVGVVSIIGGSPQCSNANKVVGLLKHDVVYRIKTNLLEILRLTTFYQNRVICTCTVNN